MKLFDVKISDKQVSDSGMALVLMLLLAGYFTSNRLFYEITIPVLAINMIYPRIFYLFAVCWMGLSKVLGMFLPRLLLALVFFLMVLPVGLFRRLIGRDALRLREFKKSSESVFKTRNHTFEWKDIEKPY